MATSGAQSIPGVTLREAYRFESSDGERMFEGTVFKKLPRRINWEARIDGTSIIEVGETRRRPLSWRSLPSGNRDRTPRSEPGPSDRSTTKRRINDTLCPVEESLTEARPVRATTAHRTPAGPGRGLRAWRSDADRRLEDLRHTELANSVRLRATVGSEVDFRADLTCRLALLSRRG